MANRIVRAIDEIFNDPWKRHRLKRFDRFLSNPRFDNQKAQEKLLKTVIGDRKRVLIAVDWTKVREWHVLVAGVIQRGRCVPVLWAVMDPQKQYKSQNAFEDVSFPVTALAHLLAMLAGTYAREKELDRHYRANTPGRAGRRAHGDFTLGLYYVLRIPWRLRAAMALLIEWTEPENWG